MDIKQDNPIGTAFGKQFLGRLANVPNQLGLGLLCCLLLCMCLTAYAGAGHADNANHANQKRWPHLAETLFQHLTTDNGLPHSFVTALAEDRDGFVWAGTQGGLARWDGYRFRVYLPDAKDAGSLPDIFVQSLHTDRRGRLWVGTNGGGLARYDGVQDRFVRIPLGPDGVSHVTVFSIVGDGGDGIWVGTRDGLDHLTPDAGGKGYAVKHFRHDSKDATSLPSDRIRTLLYDKEGRLWVGTRKGVVVRDPKTGGFTAVPLPLVADADANIVGLGQSDDGRIWAGTFEQGLFVIDAGTLAAQPFQETGSSGGLGPEAITFIKQVAPGQVWIGTYGKGIVTVDGGTAQTRRLRREVGTPTSLADDSNFSILRDRSGLIWVGGLRGISRHDPGQTAILSLFGNGNAAGSGGITDTDVTSVTSMPDGSVWLGLQNKGVNVIDAAATQITWPDATSKLSLGYVQTLAAAPNGAVYIGTNRGLYRSDLSSGQSRQIQQIQHLNLPPRDPAMVVNVLLLEGNLLLVGGGDGLWRVDIANPVAKLTATRVSGAASLDKVAIDVLARGPDGVLWIGTRGSGLCRLDPVSHQLLTIHPDPTDPAALSSGNIASLMFDAKGRLWIGTQGGGIHLLAAPNVTGKPRFKKIGSADAMPNELVNKLLEDRKGNIWASTDGGLVMIDGSSLSVRVLQRAEGVAISGYWANAGGKTAHGELLFGGIGGLTVVRPELFKPWDYRPPVVVTHVELGGQDQAASRFNHASRAGGALTDTSFSNGLLIQPNANSIAVEFSALDYSAPERNRYAYRLDGYDKDWISTSHTRRLAAYTNLPPGDYQLRLRGSNRNKVWSAQELVLPIRVLPPWYQTWWCQLAQLLAAAAAVYALVQVRTKYLRQHQHALESQVRQRTVELSQKQGELVDSNHELREAISGLVLSVDTLRQLGDIGREITANLDADNVFQSLYRHVGGLVNAPTMAIYRANAAATTLEMAFGREGDHALPYDSMTFDTPGSNVARVARERQELLINLNQEADPSHQVPGTRTMLTALYAPLIVGERVLGVMSIQSDVQDAYGERERLIFRTLSAYGAIALANAEALEALHQAQAQLAQQEKMLSLGALVAGIAHEINTPLGNTLVAISGAADTLRQLQEALIAGRLSKSLMISGTQEGLEFTGLALRAATRAAEMIAVFKTISVIPDSDLAEDIELAVYLPEVATPVRAQLALRGCTLEIEAAPGLTAHVVPEALTEALTCALANVLDHAFSAGRTGTLHLCAEAGDAGEVVITVSDNGHGIAATDLPKVFDPFFSTKSGQGHIGLGLHVAYNHVTQRIKGKIGIASTLGQGTCVTIRIQAPPQAPPQAP